MLQFATFAHIPMARLRNTVIILLFFFLSNIGFAASESSWTLPADFPIYVQSEINKWDDLGTAYKEISRNPFVGDIMVLGTQQVRTGEMTGKTYFNCSKPVAFVLPKKHSGGELRFTLWLHGDDDAQTTTYVKTSDDKLHVLNSNGKRIEAIETSDTLRPEAIWGPGKEILVQISKDTRYIWVMPGKERVAISDLRFIDKSFLESVGDLRAPQRIKTFVNEEFNFAFSVPETWSPEKDPEALLYLKAEDRLSTILIMGQLLTSQRASLDGMIKQVETLTGYKVLKNRKIIVDGVEGIERTYQASNNGVPVRLKVVYLLRNRIAYGIVCGTWEGLFNQLEPEFDRLISDFKFLDKHGMRQSYLENPSFSASNLVLATEFRGKRDFILRPGAIFAPDEEIHIYTEFSNFKVLKSNTPRYTIWLQVELRIISPSGDIIYEEKKDYNSHPVKLDEAPRFVFVHLPYRVSRSAPEGLYEVHMVSRDMVGQEELTLISRFEVRSR